MRWRRQGSGTSRFAHEFMDKYKITSTKLEELKKRKAKIDDDIRVEHARLAKEKADALCAEMAKRKAKK